MLFHRAALREAGFHRTRCGRRECDAYSRSVVQKVDVSALLVNDEGVSVVASKCQYTGVELIIGGEDANRGEFPHMAAIGWANSEGGYDFKCGGSLISSKYVLTAGHCTNDPRAYTPEPVAARLGEQNLDANVNDGADPVDPINVPTAGAQAFHMDGIGRLGHDPPRGPNADWWVLTTANAAGTNGLMCLPKHGGARDSKFLVTDPMTDHCESCLTSTIAAERASHLRHRAPQ
ncbi:hypothetical protein evm_015039 [Chilo suppressalis]|nr:hypothetical protein evm_015039 [Chilo suppressalis]